MVVVEVLTIHTQDIHKVDQTIHFQDQTIHFQAIQMVDPIILFPDSLIMVVIWIFPRAATPLLVLLRLARYQGVEIFLKLVVLVIAIAVLHDFSSEESM